MPMVFNGATKNRSGRGFPWLSSQPLHSVPLHGIFSLPKHLRHTLFAERRAKENRRIHKGMNHNVQRRRSYCRRLVLS